MCFSAEASFVSSAILTFGGVATLAQVKEKTDLPLAVFPLVFAFHQFVEGWIWLTHSNSGPLWLLPVLYRIFPIIAYSIWASLVPYSIHRLETNPLRKNLLKVCMVVGAGVSLFFLYYIVKGPIKVIIINNSIHYDFYFSFYALSQWAYGFSIIVAALLSSHKIVNLFGVGLVITYNIAKIFYEATYPSVFCYLAAILSLIIFVQIRYGHQIRQWNSNPAQSKLAPSEI